MRWWILGAFLFLLAPGGVLAQARLPARQVVINEVAWMGIPVDGVDEKQWWRYEFLELYNAGEQDVSLQGWTVELRQGEVLEFTILLYGVLQAKEYFLAAASDKIVGADVSYATLSGKFKNSGQRVVLKNAAGLVVEELDAQQGWFAGDNDLKLTMERRFFDREAGDPKNWGSSAIEGGTPKAPNSVFGKEGFLKLAPLEASQQCWLPICFQQIGPLTGWSSFIRAFLVALLSAVGILLLRRHVLPTRSRGGGSSDALRD